MTRTRVPSPAAITRPEPTRAHPGYLEDVLALAMARALTMDVTVSRALLRERLASSVRRIESEGEPISEMEMDAVVSTILHNMAGPDGAVGRT